MKTLKTVKELAQDIVDLNQTEDGWDARDAAALLTTHTQSIIEMIEGMKLPYTNEHGSRTFYYVGAGARMRTYERNKALTDIQTKLRETLK